MRFVLGLVLGMLVGAVVTVLAVQDESETPVSEGTSDLREGHRTRAPTLMTARKDADESPAPPSLDAAPADDSGMLGVGQGLVLATGEVVGREDIDRADLVVQDVRRAELSIATPHGSAKGALPLGALGVPRGYADLAAKFDSAPAKLPYPNVSLGSPTPQGIAFVQGEDGRTYVIWIERILFHDAVLRRRVRIGRRQVERVEGGGVADLPSAVESAEGIVSTRDLEAIGTAAKAMPGNMNAAVKRLGGDLKVAKNVGGKLDLSPGSSGLVLPEPLSGELTIQNTSVVVAAKGDADGAKAKIGFHGVLVILGDLLGDHELEGHALLYVTGDVLGTVKMGTHAALVIEGDLRGTVRMAVHCKVAVLGAIRGDIQYRKEDNAVWAALVLDRFVAEADMALLPKGGTWPVLWVRESDLEPGTHRGVAGYYEVHVGGDFWKQLRR